MPRRGRPQAATPAQVARVRSLAAQKVSERKIAEIVFGDARYRGRVERILRPRPQSSTRDSGGEDDSLVSAHRRVRSDDLETPSICELVNRHRERLTRSGELPSLKELELFLKLERELDTQETLEHLNALTREAR